MLDREINPPDSYIREREEEETNIGRCSQCNDPAELYVLGFATRYRKHTDMCCSYCLNELHQNPE